MSYLYTRDPKLGTSVIPRVFGNRLRLRKPEAYSKPGLDGEMLFHSPSARPSSTHGFKAPSALFHSGSQITSTERWIGQHTESRSARSRGVEQPKSKEKGGPSSTQHTPNLNPKPEPESP